MSKRVGAGLAIMTIAAALFPREAIAEDLLALRAPHRARTPAAALDPALGQQFDAQATAAKLSSPEDLLAFALRTTASALQFGLGHRTRLSFETTPREGNCVEYAELFSSILNRERGSVDARAWVVRSDARVLGKMLPGGAWQDHDWVLVVVRTPEGTKRLYVDPTFYDMGLGWDISPLVHGEVRLPP